MFLMKFVLPLVICVSASLALKNCESDGSCEANADGVSLLMKGKPKVIMAEKTITSASVSSALGTGEFALAKLTTLPAEMGSCNTWMKLGGCKRWSEVTVCGKTEQEVFDLLDAAFTNTKWTDRVIIGAWSKNSPDAQKLISGATGNKCHSKCTAASHKWNTQNKGWQYKCQKDKCADCLQCNGLWIKDGNSKMPYASAQPSMCGEVSQVQFLVQSKGKTGLPVITKVVETLEQAGLVQPFTCASEHWMRTRMSEMLEVDPSPLLLESFPDVEDVVDSNIQTLLDEGGVISDNLDGNESDIEDVDSQIERLEEIKAHVSSVEKEIVNKMAWIHKRFGNDHGIAMGPRFIRMIFHDAIDYRNLQSGKGVSVCDKNNECGGVDFRLHTALLSVGLHQKSLPVDPQQDLNILFENLVDEDEEDGDEVEYEAIGDPNHNRGLKNARHWVTAWGSHQTILSKADIMVLGAHVAVEAWLDGPELTFSRGRFDADHISSSLSESNYCNDEDCQGQNSLFLAAPVAEPVADGMFCPATTTLAGIQNLLGFNTSQMVALQGSHSVGGIIRCSGMGNTGQGPFCGGVKCCPPGMKLVAGQCVCEKEDCRTLSLGMNGATFDGTPNKLDNFYYKQLDAANFTELPDCNDLDGVMPKLGSGDQRLFICMKKKGIQYKASEGNASWDDVVKAGCAEAIKGAYNGHNEAKCQNMWKPNGKGFNYAARSWCEADSCMDDCAKKKECGEKPLHEINVLLSKFQNRDYGKKCERMVFTTHVSEIQAVIDAIKVDEYMETTIEDDVILTDVDGITSSFKNLSLWKLKGNGGKVRMKRTLIQKLADAPKTTPGFLKDPFEMQFVDPEDPKCDQCTLPACQQDSLAALENALDMVKPDDGTSVRDWLSSVMQSCLACKEKCTDANSGPAENTAPEWCLVRNKESICARGGGNHECPNEHKFAIPNHGDGRRTLIWNTLRWSRFRGQTRRVAMLPADWAQLGDSQQREAVKNFAQDNKAWQRMWAQVFTTISELGMKPERKLQCTKVTCTFDGDAIVCENTLNPGVGVQGLVFDECKEGLTGLSINETCELVRNVGVYAVFSCAQQSKDLYCTTLRDRATQGKAQMELSYAGEHDTCYDDMLDTDF